jgi:glycosyltransferase involved in cell wall biosynthesis
MYHANIFVRVSRFFIHFPKLICTAHSNNEGGVGRMLIYRATDFLGDVFSNVSNIAVESFERKKAAPKKSMITVYNGIDTERFKFNPLAREKVRSCLGLNNKKVFIAVGRLSVEKDYPNLILSFKCLTEKFPDARLVIVGTGVEENNIRNLIRIESLENRVQMLGLRKDISELLSAADIFVLSSSFEGFGLVVAEAMATNCYVVATDCGGVKEIVGNHGVLVKPGSVDEMSSALIMAYNKDWERIENDQCRDRIRRKFSLNSVVEQWDEIYAKSY